MSRHLSRRIGGGLTTIALALSVLGCAGGPAPQQEEEPSVQLGAQIWTGTCNRCHNARPASEFTAEQWPVIVRHMRTRADLTRQEAEAVTAFLQELAERGGG